MRARAFTLIELLAVIAIIAVLAALLIPLTNFFKAESKKAKGISNMRQIGIGLANSLADCNGKFPFANDYQAVWTYDWNLGDYSGLGKVWQLGYLGNGQVLSSPALPGFTTSESTMTFPENGAARLRVLYLPSIPRLADPLSSAERRTPSSKRAVVTDEFPWWVENSGAYGKGNIVLYGDGSAIFRKGKASASNTGDNAWHVHELDR